MPRKVSDNGSAVRKIQVAHGSLAPKTGKSGRKVERSHVRGNEGVVRKREDAANALRLRIRKLLFQQGEGFIGKVQI